MSERRRDAHQSPTAAAPRLARSFPPPPLDRGSTGKGTKGELLESLLDGERTTFDLAVRARVHGSVVRRHMADLIRTGDVQARLERGGRGRPRTLYSLTDRGREEPFSGYERLLSCLVRAGERRLGDRATRALFRAAARVLASELGFPAPSATVTLRLRSIGFQPELRSRPGGRVMISRNCPVMRFAQQKPTWACEELHSALLGAAFPRAKVELGQTMARGAPECAHLITFR